MEQDITVITQYFPDLTPDQLQKLGRMSALYADWNEKINVISRKDMENFYEKHVLHSLAIAKFHTFLPNERVLDIGTGGGFPGIPLAILFPETQFLLADSIGKKISVVQDVINILRLKNASAVHARVEDTGWAFDHAVTRAVAPLKELHGWTRKLPKKSSKQNLLICLKGGDLSLEIKESKLEVVEHAIASLFSEPFFETKKVVIASY